jgi:hypothetical protein
MEIHRAVKFASEIFCRWYLQYWWNWFIFSCYAGWFPNLQTHNSTGSKEVMDRVTVLFCSTKPWCFNRISMENLSVLYCANKHVWMTFEMFMERLLFWTWNNNIYQGKLYWLLTPIQHTLSQILCKISNLNFWLLSPHPWYSQQTWESYKNWRPYIKQSW